ncbi:MAG: ATP-dependent zinc protease [Gammaproteobacteria bacterium]
MTAAAKRPRPQLRMLGWREWVRFPDLPLPPIKAKVDTGARTSCLHAFEVSSFERDGKDWVRFRVHPDQRDRSRVAVCEAPVLDRRQVADSGGHREMRWVIETRIEIADQRQRVEMTLTDRDTMRFRMLLGRSAMKGRFTVNPSRSYLCGKPAAATDDREVEH